MVNKEYGNESFSLEIYTPQHTDLPGKRFPPCQLVYPDAMRSPIIARQVFSLFSQIFEEKILSGKYISSEAARRATEYPLPASFYLMARLFNRSRSKNLVWEESNVSLVKERELNGSCQIQNFAVWAPNSNGRKINLGLVNAVFLDDHDIIPFSVSHLMPDMYTSRLTYRRLNQVAKDRNFTALFAGPMQPDCAIQFSEGIRFANGFAADHEFIAQNYPFYTASPITFPGIPDSDSSSVVWSGESSTDIGGVDYGQNTIIIPNLSATITSCGFVYHLVDSNDRPKDGYLFHPPGVDGAGWSVKKSKKVESLSVLVKYSGERNGWAVVGNWGSFIVSFAEQTKLVKKMLEKSGRSPEFIVFRDHSGAVGVSFPGYNLAVGLPPKLLGITEQHTLASMFGAVPKDKAEEVWRKLSHKK